jgi:hypothetical protein
VLATPAWSLPAFAGAAVGVAGLLGLTGAARKARAAAADPQAGAAAAVYEPLGLPGAAAIVLAAQGCAHVALLAAGAGAHSGQGGSIALHVALALASGLLVWSAERVLVRALAGLDSALTAAIELLLRISPPGPRLVPAPAGRPAAAGRRGRAPPVAA